MSYKFSLPLVLSLLVSGSLCPAAESQLGNKVADFTLQDYRGAQHSLGEIADKKPVVVAFLGTECPLAKLYSPRLAALEKLYAPKGVAFVAINSNRQDSITEIAAHARRHELSFPVLKDVGNRVADAIGAVRTPEVFLLDREHRIVYHGRIDDQYGVGYVRDEPKREDLKEAIEQLLAGEKIEVAETEAVGCFIGRIRESKTNSEVTYSNQIARLLQNRCVECHRAGEIAPFALTNYEEVVGWAETIAEVVRDRRMPPWHANPKHGEFLNDRHLSDEERQLIETWVNNGAPEGNANDLPKPREFVSGWQLPREPDLVLEITPEPVKIAVEGAVRYQYFRVDPGFKEDKWIQAAELLPGNHLVVHHILAFARPAGGNGRGAGGGANGFLVGYVPGLRVHPFPAGMAKRIPAGSELVFQMHYTPIGSEQFDQSKIGFVFADGEKLTHEVRTVSASQRNLNIPPHDDNYRAEASSMRAGGPVRVLSMMPHMHLRGKSFRYEAEFADGTSEILLDIPRYDFNWQSSYRFREPRSLPTGTRIRCSAHYDNSEHNLNNPDPTKTIRWGDQTWDEMMIGYFDIAVPLSEKSAQQSPATPARKADEAIKWAEETIAKYDSNDDGQISRDEVPEKLHPLFDRIDRDSNKLVTREELIKAATKRRKR